jgi:hypothetical protein
VYRVYRVCRVYRVYRVYDTRHVLLQGQSSGAMCSYFAPNGVSCCGNNYLLNEVIRASPSPPLPPSLPFSPLLPPSPPPLSHSPPPPPSSLFLSCPPSSLILSLLSPLSSHPTHTPLR